MRTSFSTRMKNRPTLTLRIFRLFLILAAVSTLGGCSGSDPLAVASGPVFPLNAGHWQPSAGDLAATPAVTDR